MMSYNLKMTSENQNLKTKSIFPDPHTYYTIPENLLFNFQSRQTAAKS